MDILKQDNDSDVEILEPEVLKDHYRVQQLRLIKALSNCPCQIPKKWENFQNLVINVLNLQLSTKLIFSVWTGLFTAEQLIESTDSLDACNDEVIQSFKQSCEPSKSTEFSNEPCENEIPEQYVHHCDSLSKYTESSNEYCENEIPEQYAEQSGSWSKYTEFSNEYCENEIPEQYVEHSDSFSKYVEFSNEHCRNEIPTKQSAEQSWKLSKCTKFSHEHCESEIPKKFIDSFSSFSGEGKKVKKKELTKEQRKKKRRKRNIKRKKEMLKKEMMGLLSKKQMKKNQKKMENLHQFKMMRMMKKKKKYNHYRSVFNEEQTDTSHFKHLPDKHLPEAQVVKKELERVGKNFILSKKYENKRVVNNWTCYENSS